MQLTKVNQNHSQTRLLEGHCGPVASFFVGHPDFPNPEPPKMDVCWLVHQLKPPLSKHLLWFRILPLNFDKVANWEITSTITPTNLGTTIMLMLSKNTPEIIVSSTKNNLEVDVTIILSLKHENILGNVAEHVKYPWRTWNTCNENCTICIFRTHLCLLQLLL